MSKQIVEDNIWSDRIPAAHKYYDVWAELFKCATLEKYYEGFQWGSQVNLNYNPYVINKVFETIQIKLAQFCPTFPEFKVSAKPGNSDWDLESAAFSSQLKEDVLNTIIQNPKTQFVSELEMAYKDSFFRFGMLQVGYAAEWILNPNRNKPLLGKDVDTNNTGKAAYKIKEQPEELPTEERVFIKHIPAKNFRVGGIDNKYLNRCGWVGYSEYIYKEDLLALKILNRTKVETAQGYTQEKDRDTFEEGVPDEKYRHEAVKLWFIWDLRTRMHLLILDSPCVTVYQKPFKRLPLFDYRPDRRLSTEGFYPVPQVFHWLSPQNEINETREMLRAHRRRFVRKFQIIQDQVDDEEIEKFETGPDGALVKVKRENAITPILNAPLGPELAEAIQTSGDDLNRISGTSDESRGVADRTTATQANIINQRSGIRENKERDRISAWVSGVGEEVLLICRERFSAGVWAKLTSPEGETFLGEIKEHPELYKYVTTEDLNDGYDYKIVVDVSSLSVASQQEEKQKFMEFLSILTQFPQIAFSPYLVREAAYRVGYRNEKAIQELQKMALLMEIGRQQQLQAQAAPPSNGTAPQQIQQQATPPAGEQIRNQLQNQLGVTK